MSATTNIIDKFGGIKALANALGYENASTVQGWKKRDNIPSRYIPKIIQAGKDAKPKIRLRALHFFD